MKRGVSTLLQNQLELILLRTTTRVVVVTALRYYLHFRLENLVFA